MAVREARSDVELSGVRTEIVCSEFRNQFFVLITQVNKVGSLLKAWHEPRMDGGVRFYVENMLGRRDDPLLGLYARQLIEQFNRFTTKPIVLAISLSDAGRDKEHFQSIVNRTAEIALQLHCQSNSSLE